MANDLFSKYIWLIDTIKKHGKITRDEINRCWLNSPFSNGDPLPRRTFYNYRTPRPLRGSAITYHLFTLTYNLN